MSPVIRFYPTKCFTSGRVRAQLVRGSHVLTAAAIMWSGELRHGRVCEVVNRESHGMKSVTR